MSKDMPDFLDQDRPKKVKEIYKALKRDHPEYSAGKKARIASSKGMAKAGALAKKVPSKRIADFLKLKGSPQYKNVSYARSINHPMLGHGRKKVAAELKRLRKSASAIPGKKKVCYFRNGKRMCFYPKGEKDLTKKSGIELSLRGYSIDPSEHDRRLNEESYYQKYEKQLKALNKKYPYKKFQEADKSKFIRRKKRLLGLLKDKETFDNAGYLKANKARFSKHMKRLRARDKKIQSLLPETEDQYLGKITTPHNPGSKLVAQVLGRYSKKWGTEKATDHSYSYKPKSVNLSRKDLKALYSEYDSIAKKDHEYKKYKDHHEAFKSHIKHLLDAKNLKAARLEYH